MRNLNSYMVRPRSVLRSEKLTLLTPLDSALEKTFVRAGTTSALSGTLGHFRFCFQAEKNHKTMSFGMQTVDCPVARYTDAIWPTVTSCLRLT